MTPEEIAALRALAEAATPRCLVGIEGCDCDDPYTFADGMVMVPSFCECHDCYVCGEIDCDGHAEDGPQ